MKRIMAFCYLLATFAVTLAFTSTTFQEDEKVDQVSAVEHADQELQPLLSMEYQAVNPAPFFYRYDEPAVTAYTAEEPPEGVNTADSDRHTALEEPVPI